MKDRAPFFHVFCNNGVKSISRDEVIIAPLYLTVSVFASELLMFFGVMLVSHHLAARVRELNQRDAAAPQRDRLLERLLLVAGIFLVASFFLPTGRAMNGRISFSWDLMGLSDSESSSGMFIYPLVAGMLSIFLSLFAQIPKLWKGIGTLVLGVLSILIFFSGHNLPKAAAVACLSGGCYLWIKNSKSMPAKIMSGLGLLFLLLTFFVPYEELVPIGGVDKKILFACEIADLKSSVSTFGSIGSILALLMFPVGLMGLMIFISPKTDKQLSNYKNVLMIVGISLVFLDPIIDVTRFFYSWAIETYPFIHLTWAAEWIAFLLFFLLGVKSITECITIEKLSFFKKEKSIPLEKPVGSTIESAVSAPSEKPSVANEDATHRLVEIKKLLEAGLITQQEFDIKKKEILSSL